MSSRGTAAPGRAIGASLRVLLALLLMCSAFPTRAEASVRYDAVAIAVPAQDATVQNNQGRVEVVVEVLPRLRPGDRIVLLIDGSVAASGAAPRFTLQGVDRGTHTLQAKITAADGSPIAASAETVFHLWRASRLFPGRKD